MKSRSYIRLFQITIAISVVISLFTNCIYNKQTQDKPEITVSILPIKYIVERIAGDDFTLHVLVPPGASPETYEPTPSQMIEVANSQSVFITGLIDFERSLTAKLASQCTDNKYIELSKNITLIKGDCGHSHKNSNGGTDPHIWSSARNLRIMAATTFERLNALYPDSVKYTVNYHAFCAQLDSLDAQIAQNITASNIKCFVIYHPALTYYSNDYNIEQISLEHEGKEPSAENLRRVITRAKAENIKRVLYQKQFSPASVATVARELGAECTEIDPLHEDVVANLLHITEIITSDGVPDRH